MKKIKKNYDEQLIEQITNTLEMLLDKGFVCIVRVHGDISEALLEKTVRVLSHVK